MNDKPFTLYFINSLNGINDIYYDNFQINAGKINDVKRISKGMTLMGLKENSNYYMIVGDNSNIISMGMVKTIETKNKNIIYIGQKVYSNSQKELYDYIKREVTENIQRIQREIARVQTQAQVGSTAYDVYIGRMYETIKTINTRAKELITNLKNV